MKDNKNNKANFDVIQKHSIFARKERMETSPHSLLQFVKKNEFIRITGGTLPHWHQTGKVQFVTFRLADSLPKAKLEEWKTLKTQWLEAHPKPWDDNAKREYSLFFGEKITVSGLITGQDLISQLKPEGVFGEHLFLPVSVFRF